MTLREARHPLLEDVLRRQQKPMVPISLALDEKHRTLLISGPNTGGKTVSMKTTGLLVLMAQAGLPVPAAEAEFPVFEQVLAEIGDQQSIAESLSSFSAHIAHVRDMLLDVTPQSLVLLDELGRATDPEEGGALGVAILDMFRSNGAFTLASTHLLALKMYGATTEGVLNASMGFDEQDTRADLCFALGCAGQIGRAGYRLPTRTLAGVDRASPRADVGTGTRHGARSWTNCTSGFAIAEEEQDLREQRRRWRRASRRSPRSSSSARRPSSARWKNGCEPQWRHLKRRTGDHPENTGRRGAAQSRRASRAPGGKNEARVRGESAGRRVRGDAGRRTRFSIEEGARVRLKGVREPARVRRKLSGGLIEVEAGLMKMQMSIDDVEEVLPSAPEGTSIPQNVSYEPGPSWDVSYREINVIGKRAEEARENVDKFLDSAAWPRWIACASCTVMAWAF